MQSRLTVSLRTNVGRQRSRLWPRPSYHSIGYFIAGSDVVIIILSNLLGHIAYSLFTDGRVSNVDLAVGIGLISGASYVLLGRSMGLYRLENLSSTLKNLRRVILCSLFASLCLTAMLFLLKTGANFSRGALLGAAAIQLSGLLITRLIAVGTIKRMMHQGAISGQPVVLVGDADELARLSDATLLYHYGLQNVGRTILRRTDDGLDGMADALELAQQTNAEAFVLAMSWQHNAHLALVDAALRMSPLPVRLLPDHVARSVLGRRAATRVGSNFVVELQRPPMMLREQLSKRALDIFVASFAILMLSPILIFTAMLVKIDSAGPIIFRQRRNGFNQQRFTIFKFRTMTVCEDGPTIVQASQGDKRVTRIGRILRRTSLDELPQLFNVLRGDMSLVGPRPHALAHDDIYKTLIETYCLRHHVKPGITGWAQINGHRGETRRLEEMQSRVECDVWYVNNWSIMLDMVILVRTFIEVLHHDAY